MQATDKECRKQIKDKRGTAWGYFTQKEAGARGITNQDIIGDVFRNTKERPKAKIVSEDGVGQLAVYPYKRKLGFLEKEIGYIPCTDEQGESFYVRVVRKNFLRVLLPLLIILLLAAAGISWYFFRDKGPKIEERAIAYQLPGGAKNEDSSSILYPAFESVDVESDGKVHTALANVEGNPAYLKYKMILVETGETLYETDYLEPGTAVTDFKLNRSLEPGEYAVRFEIDAGSLSDYTKPLNGSVIETVLNVSE